MPGYGSQVTLQDITHDNIWLIEVVDAICKMFNLVIFTDSSRKEVYIEPMERFYSQKEWEWSDKVDYSEPIEVADIGVDEPQRVELCYREGDFASKQLSEQEGAKLGSWSFDNPTYGAKMTTKRVVNPLFTTGVNKRGQYALAPSASILQVGDSSAEGAMDSPFTTHIVRYAGLRPLPEGENWGYPINDNRYPLAAFFFEGDEILYLCRTAMNQAHNFHDANYSTFGRIKL